MASAGGSGDTPTTPRTIAPVKLLALVAAVATLLAAAGVTMWAIIVNPPGGTVGKSFLTLVLMAGFAFAVIGEANASDRRPAWVTTGRILGLVLIVASGLYLTWHDARDAFTEGGVDVFAWFGVTALIEGIACTLLFVAPAWVRRMRSVTSRVALSAGIALVIACTLLVSVPWTFWDLSVWNDTYWRVVLAITVLAIVVLVVPLVIDAILSPQRARAMPVVPYPTYAPPGYGAMPPPGMPPPGAVPPHPAIPPGQQQGQQQGQPPVASPGSVPPGYGAR
jgi:hypothetical protein